MRLLRCCLLFACWGVSTLAFAQKEDWLPITEQDQKIKEVPGNPGAPAIQLYYAEHIDDSQNMKFVYHRIKVLSEKALQPQGPADVEIIVPPDSSVRDLKARTIHPDGKIIDFTDKPFEKVVVKGRGIKFLAKTFTFPEATVGSILEYKYVLNTPANSVYLFSEWTIQHNLFTAKENLTMTPYLEGLKGFSQGYQISSVSTNLPKDVKYEKKGRGWQLNAQNLPAFESEGYMPPEDNYKPQVRFFYISYQPDSDDKYWHDLGKTLYEESERFIGNRVEVKEAALAAVGGEASPEGKLRRLYARAQQIRNLSFERERTEEETRGESIKENENASGEGQRRRSLSRSRHPVLSLRPAALGTDLDPGFETGQKGRRAGDRATGHAGQSRGPSSGHRVSGPHRRAEGRDRDSVPRRRGPGTPPSCAQDRRCREKKDAGR
jgi:hypothetical protein